MALWCDKEFRGGSTSTAAKQLVDNSLFFGGIRDATFENACSPLPASPDVIAAAGGCFSLAGTQTSLSVWRVSPLSSVHPVPPECYEVKHLGTTRPGQHSAAQEGRRFNSWTSFFFKFLAFSHAGGRARWPGCFHTVEASPKRVLSVWLLISKGLKTNFVSVALPTPRSLLTAVYRFHMMSGKASDIQWGLTTTSLIPSQSLSRFYIFMDFHDWTLICVTSYTASAASRAHVSKRLW